MNTIPTTLDHLSAFWQAWCRDNGIEPQSADEIAMHELTDAQRKVVLRFLQLWDALA